MTYSHIIKPDLQKTL